MDEKEKLKNRIADHFKAHFQHFGFKKTSMDEIAKEMQISKKTIYQFFDAKEKIFYFVVSRIARGIRSGMEKELSRYSSSRQQLSELLQMIFKESQKWLRKNDAFEFRYKYEIGSLAFKDAFSDLLKKIIQTGMEKGEFVLAPLDIRIRFVQGVISEGMNMLTAEPDRPICEEVSKSVMKILL